MKNVKNNKKAKLNKDNKIIKNNKKGNLKKIKKQDLVLLAIIFGLLGFLSCQVGIYYNNKLENNRLISLKNEYEALNKEIENYNILKVQYEFILEDANNLDINKKQLEAKIISLNNEIDNLEKKIADVNKKIKNLS